jgi:hypothetical protein
VFEGSSATSFRNWGVSIPRGGKTPIQDITGKHRKLVQNRRDRAHKMLQDD